MKEKESEKRKERMGERVESRRKRLLLLTSFPHAYNMNTISYHMFYYCMYECRYVCMYMYLVLFNLLLKDVSILSWWREGH